MRNLRHILAALLLVALVAASSWAATAVFETSRISGGVRPQLLNNAAATSTAVDTAGWKKLTFILATGDSNTTLDCALAENTTPGGTFTAITAAALVQIASGQGNLAYAIQLDLSPPRMRYINAVVTAGNGATGVYLTGAFLLEAGRYAPVTTTDKGLQQYVRR